MMWLEHTDRLVVGGVMPLGVGGAQRQFVDFGEESSIVGLAPVRACRS